MEVHFTAEQEARLAEIATTAGTDPERLVKDAALRLLQEDSRFRAAVRKLPEAKLDEIAPGKDHSLYVMLHGAIQHDLYHAGQIAVLKKALQ